MVMASIIPGGRTVLVWFEVADPVRQLRKDDPASALPWWAGTMTLHADEGGPREFRLARLTAAMRMTARRLHITHAVLPQAIMPRSKLAEWHEAVLEADGAVENALRAEGVRIQRSYRSAPKHQVPLASLRKFAHSAGGLLPERMSSPALRATIMGAYALTMERGEC